MTTHKKQNIILVSNCYTCPAKLLPKSQLFYKKLSTLTKFKNHSKVGTKTSACSITVFTASKNNLKIYI